MVCEGITSTSAIHKRVQYNKECSASSTQWFSWNDRLLFLESLRFSGFLSSGRLLWWCRQLLVDRVFAGRLRRCRSFRCKFVAKGNRKACDLHTECILAILERHPQHGTSVWVIGILKNNVNDHGQSKLVHTLAELLFCFLKLFRHL